MLDLEEFLPYRLSVLSNRISNGIARTYQERFDLSVTEWRVIAIVGRYPGVTATEVAERAAMDKVAVSRAVSRLLESGRLERHDNHPDRRAKRLYLSGEGEDIHEAIVPAALAYERDLLEALEPEERRRFLDSLERLARVAERHG
ncbi:MarR family winged helix-turn-helix transcriptional regulator [Wenzhouxiangella sp. EGI_FJ10305]|uniref:MarR family winged helix-turn-helix transcriptional regulator n=1 Tax=Wenzhouxiangella sp. EGI_FJ10305 TaxID=3243768 RepID=UPI0035DA00B4